jgi:hypothetical protein
MRRLVVGRQVSPRRSWPSSWSRSLIASASAVRPSARTTVVGFVDSRVTCLNLFPASAAQAAAVLMAGTVSATTDKCV